MKKWLVEKFLPMWAKETVLAENEKLKRENNHLSQEYLCAVSYIDGVEMALKNVRRMQETGGN